MKPLLGKTILVVDDEVDLCEITAEELERAGAKVWQAHSGNEGFGIFEKNHIDLIVSDFRMSNGTGIDLLHAVKSSSRNVTRIVFLTGCPDLKVEDVLNAGAEGVISKPYDMTDLVRTIVQLLMPLEKRLRAERVILPEDFVLSLEIEGIEYAKKCGILNISRGGMFVATQAAFPKVGQTISFRIHFKPIVPEMDCFSGFGTCRWSRREESLCGRPGFGVEFLGLEEKSLKFLLKLIEVAKSLAYIPKG